MRGHSIAIAMLMLGCSSTNGPSQIGSSDGGTDPTNDPSPTDDGCGGAGALPRCAVGKKCKLDRDCVSSACSYANVCVESPSCKVHLGGDTCGLGEVGGPSSQEESCCRSLPVAGFVDGAHPGQTVYLDKYEITAGRVRAFIAAISAAAGKPDIKSWISAHAPSIWDPTWTQFLPSDRDDGTTVHVAKNLLGDVRGLPGDPPPPSEDRDIPTGLDYQFNGVFFLYLHGHNCGTTKDAYAWPTWYYPADVLAKADSTTLLPFPDAKTMSGDTIAASDYLDVKAMNCITNAMLAAFCAWDGGQLATSEVLDFVTASPPELGDSPGCGTQIGTENPPSTPASQTGGRCADLLKVNAMFDAGATLPGPGTDLNPNNYVYPFFPDGTTNDKSWQVAAPGRGSLAAGGDAVDAIALSPGDEPWMDLAGNLNEAVLTTKNGAFTGRFGIKYRGLGYQSARSELNVKTDWPNEDGVARYWRPEGKAAWRGGRCMRFR
ncbi:MAG TPA: hypothetical protein VIF62_19350 [Labilithrix sp.]